MRLTATVAVTLRVWAICAMMAPMVLVCCSGVPAKSSAMLTTGVVPGLVGATLGEAVGRGVGAGLGLVVLPLAVALGNADVGATEGLKSKEYEDEDDCGSPASASSARRASSWGGVGGWMSGWVDEHVSVAGPCPRTAASTYHQEPVLGQRQVGGEKAGEAALLTGIGLWEEHAWKGEV